MIPNIIARLLILLFGALYPAYMSYKAIKYKNIKEVVRLTMHWIVFSMFLVLENVTDFIIFWLPFYYDIKCLFVLYLVLPFTQGSSIIYRKIIHPHLNRKEMEIDEVIENATETGFTALRHYGSKGLKYAATFIVNTALKGQDFLVNHMRDRNRSINNLVPAKKGIDTKYSLFQQSGRNRDNINFENPTIPFSSRASIDSPVKAFDHELLQKNSVLCDVRETEEEDIYMQFLSRSPSQASRTSSYSKPRNSLQSSLIVSSLLLPTNPSGRSVVGCVTQISSHINCNVQHQQSTGRE